MAEMLFLLGACYDDARDALAEHRSVEAVWRQGVSSGHFAATVVAKNGDGGIEIVEPSRREAGLDLRDGRAIGAVAALVLDGSNAGLVVVYPQDLSDGVSAAITRAKTTVHATASVSGEHLAAEAVHVRSVAGEAVTRADRDRLTRLLALLSPSSRWAVEHRHAPLLCVLGVIDAPDVGYANAARRRFADPSQVQARALALIEELARETRGSRREPRRRARPRLGMRIRSPRSGIETPTALLP